MKLFVGSLPYTVTDDQLRQLFVDMGEVEEAKVITDRYTNQSKGFGFVTMPNDDEARAAIAQLHDKEYEGRRLTVNEARPREDRGDRGGQNYNSRAA
jgi:RNA recognition motif-containing protein